MFENWAPLRVVFAGWSLRWFVLARTQHLWWLLSLCRCRCSYVVGDQMRHPRVFGRGVVSGNVNRGAGFNWCGEFITPGGIMQVSSVTEIFFVEVCTLCPPYTLSPDEVVGLRDEDVGRGGEKGYYSVVATAAAVASMRDSRVIKWRAPG